MNSKIEQMKSLRNGCGIQYLADAGYEILGNPIYIHDMDYRLLGYTKNAITDDPLWNDLVTVGFYSDQSVELLKNEYFFDIIANTKTIALFSSDKLEFDRMVGKILCRGKFTVACVDIINCKKPFDDDDLMGFEILCKKITREVNEDEHYQNYGETRQNNVIGDLISGRAIDKRLYTHHVADIYAGLKNYLYIAVADATKTSSAQTRLECYKKMLSQAQPAYKYAIYADYIIIVISSNNHSVNAGRYLRKLNKFAQENKFHIGISSSFENLFESRKYFLEAERALSFGLKNDGSRQIYLFDKVPTF